MWTADALRSEARRYSGDVWRIVESQSRPATMRLVDSVADQDILEQLIEQTKPNIPPSLANHHYLLQTPFRYAPVRHGSRFRRAHQREGCFYAAESPRTAMTEYAFHALLRFVESPGLPFSGRAMELTAFSVPVLTERAIDLTGPPLSRDQPIWTHLTEYAPCQALADAARGAGIAVLRSASVRDLGGGRNANILDPAALAATTPATLQTWHLLQHAQGSMARCESPMAALEWPHQAFAADPRIAAWLATQR